MTEPRIIPLFPLGVTLLPKMRLPLHIFEERYKQMVAHCLRTQMPFGIVLFDGRAIRSVGCMATIRKVIERYDDGRMDILTQGGERFVVQRLIEEKLFLQAEVSFFDDQPEVPADDLQAVTIKAWELLREVADADLGIEAQELEKSIPPSQLSFAIASLEGFSPAERQGFLEMTSPSERLRKSVQALASMVTRNRLTAEIQRVIGGNGQPPQRILDGLQESPPK
ncbi:MAG: LON peptidase substrate-binding domain-containing protein [Desulfobacterales bacterium]